jgi:selenocysteine lyase/cysteine desulfurase
VISRASQVRRLGWPATVDPDDFGGRHAAELAGQLNLDFAATTPALRAAADALLGALPAYGSVHRGGGARSRLTTDAYEDARARVARFLDCGDEHVVVFVRNTTEAINLVAASIGRRASVLCSPLEHHANLLPWRDHAVAHLPFTETADELVAETRAAFRRRRFDVLAVCGASNVTGEVIPIAKLAAEARAAGVRVLVDAAQLAPHRRISVRELDVDYLALSGHKLYAPFGTGVLVVRRDLLGDAPPLLKGGGAVRAVTLDDVAWSALPQRLEAGTQNVLGAIALAAACDTLESYGRELLDEQERVLAEALWAGLDELPGCAVLRTWPGHDDRVAVATFIVDGHDPRVVATRLAEEHGIAVRSGLFCAHPLVAHLLGEVPGLREALARARRGEDFELRGAVRASIGLGVQPGDIERLLDALSQIAG